MKWRAVGFVVAVVVVLVTALDVDRQTVVNGAGDPPHTKLVIHLRWN